MGGDTRKISFQFRFANAHAPKNPVRCNYEWHPTMDIRLAFNTCSSNECAADEFCVEFVVAWPGPTSNEPRQVDERRRKTKLAVRRNNKALDMQRIHAGGRELVVVARCAQYYYYCSSELFFFSFICMFFFISFI